MSPRNGNFTDRPEPWPSFLISSKTTNRNMRIVCYNDFFSVQLMEKYPLKHILCGHVLYEPGCSSESPTARFRASGGDFRMHEWRVTRISLMLFKSQDGPTVHGLIYLDSSDSAFADGIQVLLTRGDELPPTDAEEADGLGKIYSTVIYIITYNWDVFLTEAETHLKALSKKCVDENLSSAEQLQYTRELHQLSPIWVEVRRRLLEAKNLTSELIEHPYFPQDQRTKTRKRTERYLQKHSKTLQDQLTRCSELSVQTNVLISLIFNIATVQDSRAAVEESKAANALAASIRRVTVLTFVYLPLSLAAGIFGMNVHQITGDVAHPAIWIYIVVALTLMTGTFGTWFLWSWTFSGLEKRQKWKTRFEKRGKTGATA
ncbi:hypothetical protein BCR34DRAFT_142988 [Clohesyomyces aquaticus]|uniref:Cora-like Mg2+ transporter protein-domain-containing protein n=1 Tax=Clohesyomyces aquaticus TaxID=1231657 RepID=A0A1Y1YLW7_9PLEO|nr:hypothetical protein BCR34DRAFT_142988 [Clohesyomyces aquaticus]